jgi:multicomponent Na+:H+ antiporter subunit G
MRDIISSGLMLLGASFMLLAAIGLVRMPDLFTRMQPATKAATLGAFCMLSAVAVHFGDIGVSARAAAAIVFIILTAPVAAHMIGRAAYFVNVPLWEGTILDELRPRYDQMTHELDSDDDPENSATESETEMDSSSEPAEAVSP